MTGTTPSITDIIRDRTAVDDALLIAYYRAVLKHRQAGVPLVLMRDGQIAEVDASTIEIPPAILAKITP